MWHNLGNRKSEEKPPDGTCRICYPFVKPMGSTKTLLAVLHNFEYKVPNEQMPIGGGSWERPQAPKCLIGIDVAAERDVQLEKIASRRNLIALGEIPIPEIPSTEFTDLKSAIMQSIQRYYINDLDLDQRSSAMLYNSAYDRLMAGEYPACEGLCQTLDNSVVKRILLATTVSANTTTSYPIFHCRERPCSGKWL